MRSFAVECGTQMVVLAARAEEKLEVLAAEDGRPHTSAPADLGDLVQKQLALASSTGSEPLLLATFEAVAHSVARWADALSLRTGERWLRALGSMGSAGCRANDAARCLVLCERAALEVEQVLPPPLAEQLTRGAGSVLLTCVDRAMAAACEAAAIEALRPLSRVLPLLRCGPATWAAQRGGVALQAALGPALHQLLAALEPAAATRALRHAWAALCRMYVLELLRGYAAAASHYKNNLARHNSARAGHQPTPETDHVPPLSLEWREDFGELLRTEPRELAALFRQAGLSPIDVVRLAVRRLTVVMPRLISLSEGAAVAAVSADTALQEVPLATALAAERLLLCPALQFGAAAGEVAAGAGAVRQSTRPMCSAAR
eukprot:SAG11_NODE_3411_length_2464_cov_1.506977_2_plen_375_part_00